MKKRECILVLLLVVIILCVVLLLGEVFFSVEVFGEELGIEAGKVETEGKGGNDQVGGDFDTEGIGGSNDQASGSSQPGSKEETSPGTNGGEEGTPQASGSSKTEENEDASPATIDTETDQIAQQIELWQSYLDKYIMPNLLAILTAVGTVFAVFNRFKKILNLYKTDKEKFKAEKDNEFKLLGGEVEKALAEITMVKDKTLESISQMPISKIEEALSKNTEDTTTTALTMVQFKGLFKVLFEVLKTQTEAGLLPQSTKDKLKELLASGNNLIATNSLTEEFQNLKALAGEAGGNGLECGSIEVIQKAGHPKNGENITASPSAWKSGFEGGFANERKTFGQESLEASGASQSSFAGGSIVAERKENSLEGKSSNSPSQSSFAGGSTLITWTNGVAGEMTKGNLESSKGTTNK